MVDKFGNEIKVGDWVFYASKSKLTCLEIAKGKVYGFGPSGLVLVESYKKTIETYNKPIDVAAEMAKNYRKVSIDPMCCAVITEMQGLNEKDKESIFQEIEELESAKSTLSKLVECELSEVRMAKLLDTIGYFEEAIERLKVLGKES